MYTLPLEESFRNRVSSKSFVSLLHPQDEVEL